MLIVPAHRQGVLGVKVSIQLPHDPTGREGQAMLLPDVIVIHDPKVTCFWMSGSFQADPHLSRRPPRPQLPRRPSE